ncbi:MAG: hypothetical protein VR70_08035 [Rhodospirillaceae bacterium BRH_c57]|nr:MAG: hypothetical protein VR70_08035 [Rhodospirillaceae bacterium BRH_c57]
MDQGDCLLAPSVLDDILIVQMACACAGGRWDDGTGLGWWPSRLADDVGGLDFFGRLAPATHVWAALDAALRAARFHDEQRREAIGGKAVRVRTVFWLGPDVEEALARRLRHHKMERSDAQGVLGAAVQVGERFDRAAFESFLEGLCGQETAAVGPGGRELKAPPEDDPLLMVRRLAAALLPLPERYPLPFFRLGG